MASDHCYKHVLTAYGGYGYAHVLRNVVPVMRAKGISDEQSTRIVGFASKAMEAQAAGYSAEEIQHFC